MMDLTQILLRLVFSFLLGGLIGYERERNGHPAGFRTHLLVSMGAALIMIVSIAGFASSFPNRDPARLAAQVVSGIGFIGAGTIFKEGPTVRGLTTAASLWISSCVGLAVGAGLYLPSIFTVVLSLTALSVLNRMEQRLSNNRKNQERFIYLYCNHEPGLLKCVEGLLAVQDMPVQKMTIRPSSNYATFAYEGHEGGREIKLKISAPNNDLLLDVLDQIAELQGVEAVYWQNVQIEGD